MRYLSSILSRFYGLTWFVLVAAMLAGCSGTGTPRDYEFAPPLTPGGRLCIIQCQQARQFCQEQCGFKVQPCFLRAQQTATQQYEAYLTQQARLKQPPNQQLSDFFDDTQCHAVPCRDECATAYRTCYSGCGGQVTPVQ